MPSYETITDVHSDPAIPAETLNGVNFGIGYPPAVPLSSTRSYEVLLADSFHTAVNPSPGLFEASKKNGKIIFTDYQIYSEQDLKSLVGIEHKSKRTFVRRASGSESCVVSDKKDLWSTWTEQGDYHYWSEKAEIIKPYEQLSDEDISKALVSTHTSAMADLNSGYDLLTEIAERRQAIRLFSESSKEIGRFLASFVKEVPYYNDYAKVRPRDLLRGADKLGRNFARKWLAYRYGLMPLVYSYRDITEIVRKRKSVYQTYRNHYFNTMIDSTIPGDLSGLSIVEIPTGLTRVSSLLKARYGVDGLSSFVSNNISINPLSTAWELVPFSFVVDWFVNVGDYINAHTGLNMAHEIAGTSSVRRKMQITSFLVRKEEVTTGTVLGPFGYCDPSGIDTTESFQYDLVLPLREVHIDSYDRNVTNPGSNIGLVFNPFLDWKRYTDAASLTYLITRTKLRSL